MLSQRYRSVSIAGFSLPDKTGFNNITTSSSARPKTPRSKPKRHGGRPSRAEAERRQLHLIETAGDMFMRLGFDGTSIEAVAEAAGMSKRTVYAHYADKTALFTAVLRALIERWLVPISQFEARRGALESSLLDIGRHMLTTALAPAAIGVHRIIIAESARQPEFARLANLEGRLPAVRAVASVLQRHHERLRLSDMETAAELFMSLVVDKFLRLKCLGVAIVEDEIDAQIRAAIDLFLKGALRR